MTTPAGTRPRVLILGRDPDFGVDLLARLRALPALTTADGAEEGLHWLEGQAPGVTILAHADLGDLLRATLERFRELHPDEALILVADQRNEALCRRAMRAGAFDVLTPDDLTSAELDYVLDEAGHYITLRRGNQQAQRESARDALRRHERRAAARIVEVHGASPAWSELDMRVRRRWLSAYRQALSARDRGARADAIHEIVEEVRTQDACGELLLALHVHAMASGHGLMELGVERARDVLIDAFVACLGRADPARTNGGDHARASAWWQRWRLEGRESWWLIVDGDVRAYVQVGASGVEGVWAGKADRAGDPPALDSGPLPPLPAGLRQVEEHVGCGCVLDVRTSSTKHRHRGAA